MFMKTETRIIGVISGKGGVGKTIVAINLAAVLKEYYDKKVLLIDLNLTTPHVGLYLGLYATPTTLNDAIKMDTDIKKCIYEHPCKIDVMPSSIKITDLKDVNLDFLKQKLEIIKDEYDFIILDSSPGFGKESLITLSNCSEVLYVTNPIVHSVADIIKCREVCDMLHLKSLGIVNNKIKKKKYELNTKEIENMVGMKVISSIPYDDKVMESIISKTPAIKMSSTIRREFINLGSVISGENRKKEGFFPAFSDLFRF